MIWGWIWMDLEVDLGGFGDDLGMDLGWIWGGFGADLGRIRMDLGRIRVDLGWFWGGIWVGFGWIWRWIWADLGMIWGWGADCSLARSRSTLASVARRIAACAVEVGRGRKGESEGSECCCWDSSIVCNACCSHAMAKVQSQKARRKCRLKCMPWLCALVCSMAVGRIARCVYHARVVLLSCAMPYCLSTQAAEFDVARACCTKCRNVTRIVRAFLQFNSRGCFEEIREEAVFCLSVMQDYCGAFGGNLGNVLNINAALRQSYSRVACGTQ